MDEVKTYNLPVVATRGFVYFPHNNINIDIARSFSISAINRAKEHFDGYLILTSQIKPEEPAFNKENLYNVGVLARIETLTPSKIGTNNLRANLTILERVKLDNIGFNDFDGIYADASSLKDVSGNVTEELVLIKKLVKLIEGNYELIEKLPKKRGVLIEEGVTAAALTDIVANVVDAPIFRKQELLGCPDINERLLKLITILEEAKYAIEIEKQIEAKVRQSMEKNQKEYILRERLKAIKSELGEDYDKDGELTGWKNELQEKPYPEYIKNRVLEEIKKYEMMPNMSQEALVIRNYIDWVMSIPWYQMDEGELDINKIEKVLNEDHYGLEKIKERILEYLAVQKLVNFSKPTILCFVGAPGVGKTSLAISIARALNRKFVKMSLGGVSDEAEIRGHRRTYVGAIPGRVIQGMKKAQVLNPVFLLDEIDKIGQNSYHGDPSAALLEVLDPEQNKMFSDNYLEESYDLSHVLFIATANTMDTIPGPLRDRLEIIRLSSYTELEKLNIAKKHLIKKQLEANGLNKNNISFSDEALLHVIRYYTHEAGVRQLERELSTICRKVAVRILKNDDVDKVKVNIKLVKEFLGKEKFDYTKKETKDQVGVVTGLAYTEYGGDILNVEVTTFEGKGRTILTGSLGTVMKESADIALDYVKANAKKYNITTDFEKTDIHIHFPEGAVPKDGPSAGVTMTTALVSALTNTPVDRNVAMTGEITLRGNVLPIGGLKEKAISAHRSGIKTIIIPSENERDLDEIPDEVKEHLAIEFASNITDVLNKALVRNGAE